MATSGGNVLHPSLLNERETGMRIALVTDTFPPSVNGAAFFTERFAQALRERGHDVAVVAPSQSRRDTVARDSSGVVVYSVRSIPAFVYPGLRISPFSRGCVRKALISFAPDLVHIQNHFFLGRAALKEARDLGIPVIGTNHFMPENLTVHARLPGLAARVVNAYLWRQFTAVYAHLDAVTAPTVTAARLSKVAGLRLPIVPISNGIDMRRFHPDHDGGYLRTRYAVPDQPVLLFVGRLDKEKHVDVILRAMPAILAHCEAHFVVAGIGTLRARLERLARRLGIAEHVTFTGYVPNEDMPGLYRMATAFVMPGSAELQSIATMEAMASGVPVVASDAQALPELVGHTENGFLFRDGNSKALAKCIVALFKDEELCQQMAEECLKRIQAHDITAVITQFETLYGGVLSTTPVRHARAEGSARGARRRPGSAPARRASLVAAAAVVLTVGSLQAWEGWPERVTNTAAEEVLDNGAMHEFIGRAGVTLEAS